MTSICRTIFHLSILFHNKDNQHQKMKNTRFASKARIECKNKFLLRNVQFIVRSFAFGTHRIKNLEFVESRYLKQCHC